MEDAFITKIHVEKVRHIEDMEIKICDEQRKHLIITGKNGSGKTSLLKVIANLVEQSRRNLLYEFTEEKIFRSKFTSEVSFSFSKRIQNFNDFVFVYIPTKREEFDIPDSVRSVNITERKGLFVNMSKEFLRYMLNLDFQLYGAKADNNTALEASLTK